jgi:hypothetical protein
MTTLEQDVALLELKKKYLAINFIGLAMIVSIFLYAALVEVFKRGYILPPLDRPIPESISSMFFYIFLTVAGVIFFIVKFLNGRMAAKNPQNLSVIAVATFALAEIPAILGLILFLLVREAMYFYALMLCSLILFYLYYPRYDQWERLVLAAPPAPPPAAE